MSTAQSFFMQVQQLIASGEVEEAIRLLHELLKNSPKLNEVLLQSARLNDINRQVRLGLIDDSHADQTRNKIRAGLLELLDEIRKQENEFPDIRGEVEQFFVGTTTVQNAEKIYNIEKIDNANFS